MKFIWRIWLARFLIFVVTFLNLQCAVQFLVTPGSYTPGFELSGDVGNAFIRSLGVLFIMWNVPYVVALLHPLRHKISLIEAVVMQGIGVIGETALLLVLPGNHPVLETSVVRFINFDGSGLFFLIVALILVLWNPQKAK
jgi:hypothetical protein